MGRSTSPLSPLANGSRNDVAGLLNPDPPSRKNGLGDVLRHIHRLRYEVYCLERGFLDGTTFADGRERDEYDLHALHLAASQGEQEVVATVRLVRDSARGFPIERHARALYPEFQSLPRERTAEISRLIVARPYRRRTDADGRYCPLLFGLFREMYEQSLQRGLEYWLAAMERGLWRLLRGYGFHFHEIGAAMQYFGEVVPYVARLDDLREGYCKIVAYEQAFGARWLSDLSVRAVAATAPGAGDSS